MTTTTVLSRSERSRVSASSTICSLRASSSPVGSSASTSGAAAGVRRRDRHPLLLAAGQRAGSVPRPRAKAERSERVVRSATGSSRPASRSAGGDVLPRRQRRPQVVALEHERYLARAVGRELVVVEPLERALADPHLARRRLVERRRQRQHRALAAPGRPEHGDQLAALHAQLEAPQRDRLDRPRAVDLEHVVELERRPVELLGVGLGFPPQARDFHRQVKLWIIIR